MPIKINSTSSRAKKDMRKAGNTSDRPEEQLAFEIIKYCCSFDAIAEQYQPPNLIPLDVDLTGKKSPKIDIYVKYEDHHYAIRIMGSIHDDNSSPKRRTEYDTRQKDFLEMQVQHGGDHWIVIDIHHLKAQNLFKRNKRLLNSSEIMLAFNEIKHILLPSMLQLKFNTKWFNSTKHKRS